MTIDTQAFNVTISSNLVHDSNLGASATDAGITKIGTGTLTLSGANTFRGPIALDGGLVNLDSSTGLGLLGLITFAGGGLQYSPGFPNDESPRFAQTSNQAYLIDTNGQNVTYATPMTSAGGSLTKAGGGILTLKAADTFTGGITLNGGLLNLGGASALGTSGTIAFAGGGLQYSAVNTVDYSARFATTANQQYLIDTNGQNVNYAAALSSVGGSLTKIGAGVLTLSAANTYTGPTIIAGGILNLNNAAVLSSRTLITFAGGELQYSRNNATDYSAQFSTAANQPYQIDTNGQYVNFAAGLNSVGGSLTLSGNSDSMLTLSGASTYTGPTVLNGGVLSLNNSAATASSSSITFAGGGLQYSANNKADDSAQFAKANNQPYSVDTNGQNVTFASALVGAGSSLTKAGNGTLTLSAANTYTGPTNLYGGLVNLNNPAALGSTSVITFGGGGLQYSAVNTTDYSASFDTSNNQSYLIDTNGQNVTFATGLSSVGGTLDKVGAGTLTLSGNNTYDRVTVVSAGTLSVTGGTVGIDDGMGDEPAFIVVGETAAATLSQTGGVITAGYMSVGDNAAGTLNLSGGHASLIAYDIAVGNNATGVVTQSVGSVTLSDALSVGSATASGTYTLSGGSVTTPSLILGAGPTFGSTFIQTGGIMTVTATADFGSASTGGTYLLNGGLLSVPAITSSVTGGTLILNGGTLQATADSGSFVSNTHLLVSTTQSQIDTNGHAVTISQPLLHDPNLGPVPDGGILKVGTGTLTLGGAGTYTGTTLISAGTVVAAAPAALGSGTVLLSGGKLTLRQTVTTPGGITGFAGFATTAGSVADFNGKNSFGQTQLVPGVSPDHSTAYLTGANSGPENNSAFYPFPVSIPSGGFVARFTYKDDGSNGDQGGDYGGGFAFVIHNDPRGQLAVGEVDDSGNTLGYGGTVNFIQNSAAVQINIGDSSYNSGTGFGTNGTINDTNPLGNIDLNSNHDTPDNNPLAFTLTYDAAAHTLTEFAVDTTNASVAGSAVFTGVNYSAIGSTAYVGFTAAANGIDQTVSNFSFTGFTVSPTSIGNPVATSANQNGGIELAVSPGNLAASIGPLTVAAGSRLTIDSVTTGGATHGLLIVPSLTIAGTTAVPTGTLDLARRRPGPARRQASPAVTALGGDRLRRRGVDGGRPDQLGRGRRSRRTWRPSA